MKNYFKHNLQQIWLALIFTLCFTAITLAGNLEPPSGAVSPTMNSLQSLGSLLIGTTDSSEVEPNADGNINEQLKYIATYLQIGGGFTYGDNDPAKVLTTAESAGTYDASNLATSTVADGVTFGVSSEGELLGDTNPEYVTGTAPFPGTLLANLTHGGSGIDDYNNGGSPASGRYATGWTTCDSSNSWCGLGTDGENVASKMDNVTGLVWSFPCSLGPFVGNCTNESASATNRTIAASICSGGATYTVYTPSFVGKNGWSLPTQKQLMQAYINGAYGNLEPSGIQRHYWTSTLRSQDSSRVYTINLAFGLVDHLTSSDNSNFRCVQQAP